MTELTVRNNKSIGLRTIDSFARGMNITVHDGMIGSPLNDHAGSGTVHGAVDDGGSIRCDKDASIGLLTTRVAEGELSDYDTITRDV